ncbi:hypothetical protein D1872_236820 [compost metagenome]
MNLLPPIQPIRRAAATIRNITIAAILIIASIFSTRSNPLLPKNTINMPTTANPAANIHMGTAGNQNREKMDRAVSWLPIINNSENQYNQPLPNPAQLPNAFLA